MNNNVRLWSRVSKLNIAVEGWGASLAMTMNFDKQTIRGILCALGALLVLFSAGIQTAAARGMMNQNKNQEEQKPEAAPTLPADDPLVNEPDPPPADANLKTKLGWCEVQVYGHTFSDAGLQAANLPLLHMHLAKRLEQINQKVQFEPNKSGVQLMDDADGLVKCVSTKKKAAVATGSSSKKPAVAPAK